MPVREQDRLQEARRRGAGVAMRGALRVALRGGSQLAFVTLTIFALPGAVLAQSGAGGTGGTVGAGVIRRTTTKPATLNKVCSDLASAPSVLVHDPSGRALLGLKKDLEGAATNIEQRDPAKRLEEAQRMAEMRRGLDSLMAVVVRTTKDDSGKTQTFVTVEPTRAGARGGMAASRMDVERMQVEASIRSLEPQIAAIMAAGPMATRIPMPTGWMGVYLSRSAREVPTPEGILTYYCDYPVIEAVTAGSPAEKGGLLAGDTLVAYNGRDVTTAAVNLTTLLVPDRVVRVRYKRDGRLRDVPVTIVPRPASQQRVAFQRFQCAPGQQCESSNVMIKLDTLYGTRFEARPAMVGRANVMAPSRAAPVPPAPGVELVLRGTGVGVLMGAQLSVIDDELAQAMGVEPGVLLMRVPPSSPAGEAGLKVGEVIRAVNGAPLRDLVTLSRALAGPGVREVKLTVSARGAPPRTVVVRF